MHLSSQNFQNQVQESLGLSWAIPWTGGGVKNRGLTVEIEGKSLKIKRKRLNLFFLFDQIFDQSFGHGFDQVLGKGSKHKYTVLYYPA